MPRREKIFLFLTAIFVSSLVVANIIASKIIMVWGIVVPCAVVAYPITFLITDVVNEVEGKEKAKQLVNAGLFSSLVMLFFVWVGGILPPAPFWEHQESYTAILSGTPRIVLASIIAYYISQYHDVLSFDFWRRKTKGKHLWLRNNLSTLFSQVIDTFIFIFIAFFGVVPLKVLATMMVGQYFVKLIIALVDTPFCYLLVYLFSKKNEERISEVGFSFSKIK